MNCICGEPMRETSEVYHAKWGEYEVEINGVKAYLCDACNKLVYDSEEVNLLLNLTVLLSGLTEEKRPKVIDFKKYKVSKRIE
ncbi:MAG: YgiT-type zinc finger protein [Bacillota bacterium]|nr:YgiT-type zinc finger protein [Bacillota bacterium]